MELINVEDVNQFAGVEVEIFIHDEEGGDQAPAVKKTVKKIQLCPDSTHIRFYFDHLNFLAVPRASRVIKMEDQWSASDPESGLTYKVRKA
ncbi:hypothetical protein RCG19_14360 [Neobacillus sp. OS1-2]|uniref:hypothetical protein n=1 Tax=Neobacillus sp. OS1-2 TaxID=3070680 RepID=UPI0027DF9370|nr:hypothetical protein [Neobacillus sp. OS1-2]WML38399.1 hypothetical protein RCG19_14360 [Neobacillus sp. OS1-2]